MKDIEEFYAQSARKIGVKSEIIDARILIKYFIISK